MPFWRDDIGRDDFYPFDLMAAIFATRPDLFRCARVGVHIDETAGSMLRFLRKPALLVTPADAARPPDGVSGTALYCPGVSDDLRPWLTQRLGERRAQ